jgi:hypothetical protein
MRLWAAVRHCQWHRTLLRSIVVLAFLVGTSANAEETAERAAIKTEVARLFAAADYAALDALALRYLQGERTSSGTWKLDQYDLGLSEAFEHRADDTAYWQDLETRLGNWIAASPDSSAAHLAHARALLTRAWGYRGFGYAKDVREQDWQPFRDHVAAARKDLEVNQETGKANPLWYQMLLEVAKVQKWPVVEYMQLFDEGVARHPAFYQLYFNASSGFQPEWGGSFAAFDDFAKSAQQRSQATEGAAVYARIYWHLFESPLAARVFTETKLDWPLLRQGIQDVLAKYPDQWNINHFAKFACLAGDGELTTELTGRITLLYYSTAWKDMAEFATCQGEANKRGSLGNIVRANYYWAIGGLAILLLGGLWVLRARGRRS